MKVESPEVKVISNDQTLLLVLQILLSALQKRLKNNEFVWFPPDKVSVVDENKKKPKVSFQAEQEYDEKELTLSESVRLLGVTLYHLNRGESELNAECFIFDGYIRPMDSPFWPLVRDLANGRITAVKELEERIKDKELQKKVKEEQFSSSEESRSSRTKRQTTHLPAIADVLSTWQRFYQQEFGLSCDFSNLRIPERRPGFDRLIVIAQGITAQQVYDKCKQHFRCWKYTDDSLDIAVPTNGRDSNTQTYAIWIRERIEADEEHKNKSANQLQEQGILGITLLERLLYELKYFKETGGHLDIQNWTLCSGSRDSDGRVPVVYWYDDELEVNYGGPGHAGDGLRSREAVSA